MNQEISPEAQKLLMKFQTLQQQFQAVAMQKETFTMQKVELGKAVEELKTSNTDDVYKTVGPILIKSTKVDLEKELGEKLETIDLRLKSLETQEETFKEKLKENQEAIQKALVGAMGTENKEAAKDAPVEDKSIA
jgi:prefoldin beta subunit